MSISMLASSGTKISSAVSYTLYTWTQPVGNILHKCQGPGVSHVCTRLFVLKRKSYNLEKTSLSQEMQRNGTTIMRYRTGWSCGHFNEIRTHILRKHHTLWSCLGFYYCINPVLPSSSETVTFPSPPLLVFFFQQLPRFQSHLDGGFLSQTSINYSPFVSNFKSFHDKTWNLKRGSSILWSHT